MDRDYGVAGGETARQTIKQETALSRLSDFSVRAERVGDLIEGFLSRCKGSEDDRANEGVATVPSGHFGHIERLDKLLARAEDLARELGNVG